MTTQFQWIPFYEALADKLLEYKDDRQSLMDIMKSLYKEERLLNYLNFERQDWWDANNNEIDPFSIFGSFNRGLTKGNRIHLASRYAEKFAIKEAVPESFEGVPILNNMNSFYANKDSVMWDLFVEAMASSRKQKVTDSFKEKFDSALSTKGNGVSSLTMGLYWISPNFFINLDQTNKQFLEANYAITWKVKGFDSDVYSKILKTVKERIPNLTIPELSHQAWIADEEPSESTDAIEEDLIKEESTMPDYSPGLTVEDWVELLKDPTVFNQQSLEIMKRMKDIGGKASCVQLANKYGKSMNFYNTNSSALGKRIYEKTHCEVRIEYGKKRWWPILYTGVDASKEEEGSFIWFLRDELDEALDRVDLSQIELYTDDKLAQNSMNYWWVNASPKVWSFSSINVGETIEYTLHTDNGGKRRVHQNFLDAKVGDMVICYETNPEKKIVALGEIAQEQDGEKIVIRKTETLVNPIEYQALINLEELEDLEFFKNRNGTFFKVTPDQFAFIIDFIREENPKVSKSDLIEPYTKQDFLGDVYLTEEKYDTIISLFKHKKNIILEGAPGVGKTYAAKRIAWSMMGEKDHSRIEMVQFHQNYSYEDFIMGYKPYEDSFQLQDGVFVNFCRKAANNPEEDFFLIIDEINRGNMSKIFGELLMLIENDYRGEKLRLPYNGQLFSVPDNLYIIGMMNTADRSLAMIDYALRRRFSFVEMEPGFKSEGYQAYQASLANERFNSVMTTIQVLNSEIEEDSTLGKGFCIGHSYFTGQRMYTDEWMKRVIQYDILPMLKEYWFDEEDKVRYWENSLRGIFHD